MIFKKLGNIESPASAVGMGCWNIGNQWGEMSDADAEAIVQAALENGVTLFDVAESYGTPHGLSEIRLGRALKGKRDGLILVSKCGHWGMRSGQAVPLTTPDMIRICVHSSLGRLRTDLIDVMLAHQETLSDELAKTYVEGFRMLLEEGFIREYGISTTKIDTLKRFYELSDGEMTVVEADYSLLNDTVEKDGFLDFCIEKNISILTRGPLHQGLLSGRYDRNTVFTDSVRSAFNEGGKRHGEFLEMMDRLDALKPKLANLSDMDLPTYAIRYLISQKANIFAIPGATSVRQIVSNAQAGSRQLTAEELSFVR